MTKGRIISLEGCSYQAVEHYVGEWAARPGGGPLTREQYTRDRNYYDAVADDLTPHFFKRLRPVPRTTLEAIEAARDFARQFGYDASLHTSEDIEQMLKAVVGEAVDDFGFGWLRCHAWDGRDTAKVEGANILH